MAVVSTLVPIAGPVIDQHFAERLAVHDHTYKGTPDLEHAHAYDSDSKNFESDPDVIITMSNDGSIGGSFFLIEPQSLRGDDADGIRFLRPSDSERPDEIKLTVPVRPPRLAPILNKTEPNVRLNLV
ncbi:hypothetical protein JYT27_00380 [bacterium AH-315-D21]|nr:hypothetical protein [bacterium AH-315-D21]